MKCKNCNCELNNNTSFCTHCGTKVEVTPPAQPAVQQTAAQTAAQPAAAAPAPAEKKKKKKNGAVIVAIVVIALIIVAGIVLAATLGLFGGDKKSKDDKKSDGTAAEKEYVSVVIEGLSPDSETAVGNSDVSVEETRPMDETTMAIEETAAPDTEPEETDPPETEPEETEPEETAPPEPEEPVWEGSDRVVIANGGLNMRKNPDRTAAIINCITNGTIVTVEKVKDNWAYVTYGGKKGWCSCDYLYVPIEANTAPLYKATVRCNGNIEMISDGYAEDDLVYTDVANGTVVQVYEIDGDRAYIKYNNILGWCPTKYLEKK